MSVPTTVRYGSTQVIFESYPTVGFNYRMTDIQAAVGREQLKRLPDIVRRRRECARRHIDVLSDLAIDGLVPPAEPHWTRTNWQSFCVRLPHHAQQQRVMQRLLDVGISTRRGIMCAHREPAYAHMVQSGPLQHSINAQDGCVPLPLYASMTSADVLSVAHALGEACLQ